MEHLRPSTRLFPLFLMFSIVDCGRGTENPATDSHPPRDTMVAHAPQHRTCSGAGLVEGPEGSIAWRPGTSPSRGIIQQASWIAADGDDPECAALRPPAVPPRMSWRGSDGWCAIPVVDGHGDAAMVSFGQSQILPSDGSGGPVLASGSDENTVALVPRDDGFLLLSHGNRPSRDFAREIRRDGSEVASRCTESDAAERIQTIAANPLGGHVEGAFTVDDKTGRTLWLRWVDGAFRPTADWHAVISWQRWNQNHRWRLLIDRKGRALVLSFLYPPSLGTSAPRSQWKFSARWMGSEGPLGASFEPPAPTFTPGSHDRPPLFADWGNALALPAGGFAMFVEQASPARAGSISPAGWYALYPSGEPRTVPAPAFLQSFDGSLQLLAAGTGYAATVRDPGSCSRTALLVARSGRVCFKLPIEGSDLCDSSATFGTDGTLAIQRGCEVRWWPGLARPAELRPVLSSRGLPRGDVVVGTQAMEGIGK